MTLARAETRRLIHRRLVTVILAGTLILLAAIVAGVFLLNEQAGPEQVAEAKAMMEREYQRSVQYAQQELERCRALSGPLACGELQPPPRTDFDYSWYMPETFDMYNEFDDMILVWTAALAAAAFLIGASFIGAEWHSGSMMNLLLWQPQRLRVLGVKLGVLLGWLAALSVLLAVVWAGAFQVVATLRGTTDSMTAGAWQSFALTGLRGLVLILAAGAIGFAVASLGRHTGMALGALIGLTALQVGVIVLASLGGADYSDLYFIGTWLDAWMSKEYLLYDIESCDYAATGSCVPEHVTLTWPSAGAAIAGVTLLAVGAAMWSMHRRDVS